MFIYITVTNQFPSKSRTRPLKMQKKQICGIH